jgi:hypothetical protein
MDQMVISGVCGTHGLLDQTSPRDTGSCQQEPTAARAPRPRWLAKHFAPALLSSLLKFAPE